MHLFTIIHYCNIYLQLTQVLTLMTHNSLQALPFFSLNDTGFHILTGSSYLQLPNLKDLDLYNILPNPDKFDEADPDHMLISPESHYYDIPSLNTVLSKSGKNTISFLHCNIRSLPKHLNLLEDFLCPLNTRPYIIGITETRLNKNNL